MPLLWTNEIITYLVRQTGWHLDYVGKLPFKVAYSLAQEIMFQRSVEEWRLQACFGMCIATWANANSKNKRYKIEDFVGKEPEKQTTEVMQLSKKQVSLTVKLADGQDYELVPLDLNSMTEIEEHFDKPFSKLFGEDTRISVMRYALFIILKQKSPNITEEQVGSLVTAKILTDKYEAILSHLMG